jgi:predicted transcriptional regulator
VLSWEAGVEAHALREQGWTISAIARHLGHDRKTVRAYLAGGGCPRSGSVGRQRSQSRPGVLPASAGRGPALHRAEELNDDVADALEIAG